MAIIYLGHLNDMLREDIPKFNFKEPVMDPLELSNILIREMKNNNGVGLSANQLGIRARAFVMYTDPPMVCFNPVITNYSDEQVLLDEGCLSYPGTSVKVKRAKHIRVRFQDPYGNVITKKFTGMAARIFQHELDHLDGIEYFHRANSFHLEQFKRKWKKIVRKAKNKQ